jgi:hypothetical protein
VALCGSIVALGLFSDPIVAIMLGATQALQIG